MKTDKIREIIKLSTKIVLIGILITNISFGESKMSKWIKKHPVISGLIAVGAVAIAVGSTSDSKEKKKETSKSSAYKNRTRSYSHSSSSSHKPQRPPSGYWRKDKMTWICLKKIWASNGTVKRVCNTKFKSNYHHIDYVTCPSCGTKGSYCCIEPYNPRKHGR